MERVDQFRHGSPGLLDPPRCGNEGSNSPQSAIGKQLICDPRSTVGLEGEPGQLPLLQEATTAPSQFSASGHQAPSGLPLHFMPSIADWTFWSSEDGIFA